MVHTKKLEQVNHNVSRLLCARGFEGKLLMVDLKKEVPREEKSVMVTHTKESIEVFATSKTHGNQFEKTQGMHVTHDEEKGLSSENWRQDRAVFLRKEKAKQKANKNVEDAALEILLAPSEKIKRKQS